MPQRPLLDTEFSQRFFADILSLYPGSDRRYDCQGISDIHYCQLGVLRCLDTATTGQQFLQHHADQNVADIDPGHFFKALKSPRRLENITSLNDLLAQPMLQRVADSYATSPELAGWDLYAVDGHYHHACEQRSGFRLKLTVWNSAVEHDRFLHRPFKNRPFFLLHGVKTPGF